MNPQIQHLLSTGDAERLSSPEQREYHISAEEAKARAWAVVRRMYNPEGDMISPDRRAHVNRRRSMLLRMRQPSRLALR